MFESIKQALNGGVAILCALCVLIVCACVCLAYVWALFLFSYMRMSFFASLHKLYEE